MQYSLSTMLPIALASLFSLTQALPSGIASRSSVTQQLADAQNDWRADTSMVSQFLSAVPTLQGSKLEAAAQVALDAENDELLHKKVLDQNFSSDPRIVQANDVLVNQRTFQSVVDALANFAQNGASMTPGEISTLLQQTNSVRCSQVLPAIDTYFSVTGEKLNNGGSLLATRPTNC
ncbi:hypothetical protein E0Z10_g3275 [Xylaria hypoxylon]|uniref:Uncharacterized protein n=1 Tax=Xylaria hypoxylon TaxID=37992 RepID=A0A4Z0Z293_9PEZI|nr:hypothetical protein E0Z10_g3275 [Xylaria hypoxylon]